MHPCTGIGGSDIATSAAKASLVTYCFTVLLHAASGVIQALAHQTYLTAILPFAWWCGRCLRCVYRHYVVLQITVDIVVGRVIVAIATPGV